MIKENEHIVWEDSEKYVLNIVRVFDMLNQSAKDSFIIVNDNLELGICFSKRFNCFVWCRKDGRAVEDLSDKCGYKRVILSPHLFNEMYLPYYELKRIN